MSTPPNSISGKDGVAALRRLGCIQRLNAFVFVVAVVCIALGCAVSWRVVQVGLALGALLIVQSFVVYPFLRCPNCGHRFFIADGVWGFFTKIDPFVNTCRRCGAKAGCGLADALWALAMRWRYPLMLLVTGPVVFFAALAYGVVAVGVPTPDATPAVAAGEARDVAIAGWGMVGGAGLFVVSVVWLGVICVAKPVRLKGSIDG